jgi:hypothetical protein
VPRASPALAADPAGGQHWLEVKPLPPLVRAEDGTPPRFATRALLAWDEAALYARFECADDDAWGSHRERDAPLWEEEAVELFLAPGGEAPSLYFELEVSPRGALFDALIESPRRSRDGMTVRRDWDLEGLRLWVGRGAAREDWWAVLVLDWRGLLGAGPAGATPPPRRWRANLYRVERPRGGEAEFSAWSPTWRSPADFHLPERFGMLDLAG